MIDAIPHLPEFILGGFSDALQRAYLDADRRLYNAKTPEEKGQALWDLLVAMASIFAPLFEGPLTTMRNPTPPSIRRVPDKTPEVLKPAHHGALERNAPIPDAHVIYPEGFHSPINMKHHLAKVDGFTQKDGIKGAHNADEFSKAFFDYKLLPGNTPGNTPEFVNGIKTIYYHVQAKDSTGKLTGKPKGGKPLRQTVYDPKVHSDDKMLELGQQAAAKGYKEAREAGHREYSSSAGGINFQIYLDKKTGIITGFHPK